LKRGWCVAEPAPWRVWSQVNCCS